MNKGFVIANLAKQSRWRILLIFILAVLIGFVYWFGRGMKPAVNVPLLNELPDFSLTDQNGKPVTKQSLQGTPWIADFIFTRCAGQCPAMSNAMRALQSELRDFPSLRFVSFSVDPRWDTPERLAQYAMRYQADPARWIFLTGTEDEIFRLSREGFKLGVDPTPADAPNIAVEPVMHSSRFVLVDALGRVRGYYEATDAQGMARLKSDLRAIAYSAAS